MKIKHLLILFIGLMYLGATGQNDIITAKQFMDMVKSSDKLVIVDASAAKTYSTTHVKNAVSIPHKTLYQDGSVEGLILSPDKLAGIFGGKGVGDQNTIVVYDEGSQKYSTRVYWVLKYLGAKDVKILHKDMDEWKKVRVPLTRMPASVKAVKFTPSVDNSTIADMAYVKAHLGDANVKLIDARTPEEFNGTSTDPVSKGHIQGALNLNHKDVLNSKNAFKSKADLEAIAAKLGVSANNEIILYCKTSIRGAVLYVAFRDILGYSNVKIYDGAYAEWETKYDLVK